LQPATPWRSSSGVSVRPSAALAPSTSKKLPDTARYSTGTGSSDLQRTRPVRRTHRREVVEAVRPCPPVDEIRVRDLGALAGLHATADDQPVLVGEGNGRNMTASASANRVVFAPMPSARSATATSDS
jgi:hypothetical protein